MRQFMKKQAAAARLGMLNAFVFQSIILVLTLACLAWARRGAGGTAVPIAGNGHPLAAPLPQPWWAALYLAPAAWYSESLLLAAVGTVAGGLAYPSDVRVAARNEVLRHSAMVGLGLNISLLPLVLWLAPCLRAIGLPFD
jgi:hypothetical protein